MYAQITHTQKNAHFLVPMHNKQLLIPYEFFELAIPEIFIWIVLVVIK